MQQDNIAAHYGEQHTGDSPVKVDANFPEILAHFAYQRHSNGPADLYGLYVCANSSAILCAKAFKPFPNWLVTGIRSKEFNCKYNLNRL